MEENQRNQNLNQQPVQPVQPQPEQVQQPVQWQPQPAQPVQEPTVSMQIQQLLVQQQQYQQQYNQLVDYVKKTPNLPIEQVNQIKAQLDQLNALFVQGKQQLQALWYNQVQVQKPTEIKKWSVTNFSRKKVAIWCSIVLLLIFAWFFLTLSSLIKNPNALGWIWVDAGTAKVLLSAFIWLIFWSVILLMLGVIISNIYRLITVKNQRKWKFIRGLMWWILWAGAMLALILTISKWINKIETNIKQIDYDIIQPYLVWRVEKEWIDEFNYPYKNENMEGNGVKYPLIAPSEMAFSLRWNELIKITDSELPSWYDRDHMIVKLLCGNKDGTTLEQNTSDEGKVNRRFNWTCLYSEKWKYTYWIEITYNNTISKETKTIKYNLKTLDYTSEVSISKNSSKISSEGWEFRLWQAPVKVTVDANQIFRDFLTKEYKVEWDMDGDFVGDRTDIANFDYSYKLPKVYYVTYKFPEIYDNLWYRFPVRVEQSDKPVCWLEVERFPWTNKFQIVTDFVDSSSEATISSYNYTIQNAATKKTISELKNENKKITYEFPDKWSYIVIMKYVTIDWKQWQCESDLIQLEKETFDIQYALLAKDSETWKFKELCNSKSSGYDCTQINIKSVPQTYQVQIKSVTPTTINTSKAVYFEEASEYTENKHALMEDNDTYEFTVPDEWNYELRIFVTDKVSWIDDETKIIKFIAKKPDIVWEINITSAESNESQRRPISEGFEPLTVILDASKTEVNIKWDEIIYFTWDFWDGEIKRNIQNWVVAHTYNYDYAKENWIFQPIVTIRTKNWTEETIYGPKINVKKWLVNVNISSTSHPSRQAQAWKDVTFSAEFDGLPEKMVWDFWDWSDTVTCKWRNCTEIKHAFEKTWIFSVKLSLEFDAVQQVDKTMEFKVY